MLSLWLSAGETMREPGSGCGSQSWSGFLKNDEWRHIIRQVLHWVKLGSMQYIYWTRNQTQRLMQSNTMIKLRCDADMLLVVTSAMAKPDEQIIASSRSFYFQHSTAEFVSLCLLFFGKRSGFSISTEVESGWQCAETGHQRGGR